MMPVALLTLSLAVMPPIGLWQRETSQAPRSAVDSVLVVLRDALAAAELPADGALRRCGPIDDCLSKMAREGGVIAIGLSVAAGRKGLLADLEAVAPDGEVLASVTFPLPSSGDRSLPEVRGFVETLVFRWRARAPAPVPLAPPVSSVIEEEPVPPTFWSTVPARVTLIGTGVAVLSTIALGVAGAVVKGQLDASLALSPPVLSRPQALEQAGAANGLFTGSLVGGLISGAAGLFLIILWAGFES